MCFNVAPLPSGGGHTPLRQYVYVCMYLTPFQVRLGLSPLYSPPLPPTRGPPALFFPHRNNMLFYSLANVLPKHTSSMGFIG